MGGILLLLGMRSGLPKTGSARRRSKSRGAAHFMSAFAGLGSRFRGNERNWDTAAYTQPQRRTGAGSPLLVRPGLPTGALEFADQVVDLPPAREPGAVALYLHLRRPLERNGLRS